MHLTNNATNAAFVNNVRTVQMNHLANNRKETKNRDSTKFKTKRTIKNKKQMDMIM